MCNILALNPAVQKQILRQARDRHFDPEAMFRLRLVLAVASGRSRRCVAAVCNCAVSTCIRAVERFERGGFDALQDQRCHNGPSKLSLMARRNESNCRRIRVQASKVRADAPLDR